MSTYEERKAARIERLKNGADYYRRKAVEAFDSAARVADGIPMGQPILVGHHSERRHRADAARIENGMRRGIEEEKRAEELARRADAAANNTAISSDDPTALEALRAKLSALEAKRALMARLNREWRKGGAAALTGVTEEQRARMAADMAGREAWQSRTQPFERYQLANLGGQIRQVKQRIAVLAARASVPSSEERIGEVVIRDDADANRVQVVFPGKPDAETIAALKRAGFRWAPSVGAWQRQRSAMALEVARRIAR